MWTRWMVWLSYKALLAKGVVEAGCLTHAQRKFGELHTANKSQIAEAGIRYSPGSTRSSAR
ncbi:transposase [Variovorax paradoxus]|nr:transposase [Variovorax paradoxus]